MVDGDGEGEGGVRAASGVQPTCFCAGSNPTRENLSFLPTGTGLSSAPLSTPGRGSIAACTKPTRSRGSRVVQTAGAASAPVQAWSMESSSSRSSKSSALTARRACPSEVGVERWSSASAREGRREVRCRIDAPVGNREICEQGLGGLVSSLRPQWRLVWMTDICS